MAEVVDNVDNFLKDFIGSFSKGEDCEQGKEEQQQSSVTPPPLHSDDGEKDVWCGIEDALNRWTERMLDTESRYEKTASFRENIETSLRRQQLDGFLNHHDIAELRYITFGDGFKSVCRELFKLRRPRAAYVIAILAYALELDEYHLMHCSWYHTDILTNSLVEVLMTNGFAPYTLNMCTLL